MKILIVPAIIAQTQHELDEMLENVPILARRVQLDVMDGIFVPNTSLNFPFELPPNGFEYEAHLMMENPLDWVEENAHKVDIVLLHVETLTDIDMAINAVKMKDTKIGLAVVPKTPNEVIIPHLSKLDELLMMTVVPGSYCKGEEEFSHVSLEKIKQIRKINKTIPIEVDGCVDLKTVRLAKDAGANIFASGSFIIKSSDPERAIKELENAVM
ncbi:MAG: hypothetical protein ACE5I5_11850 [Candidatus Heimdallarchaeota archaeon]